MKETQEEREATLAYNNPWVLNYAHQQNKKPPPTKNQTTKTNKQTAQPKQVSIRITCSTVCVDFFLGELQLHFCFLIDMAKF